MFTVRSSAAKLLFFHGERGARLAAGKPEIISERNEERKGERGERRLAAIDAVAATWFILACIDRCDRNFQIACLISPPPSSRMQTNVVGTRVFPRTLLPYFSHGPPETRVPSCRDIRNRLGLVCNFSAN